MPQTFELGLDFLRDQGPVGFFSLFWLVLMFDVPRQLLAAIAALPIFAPRLLSTRRAQALGPVSVVIAGHNEEDAIIACIDSLLAQSLVPDEIIVVSDGSTDSTRAVTRALLRQGKIQGAHGTDLRAGKAAAVNLGIRQAHGAIVLNVDCDCSFDRHAVRNIVAPFADPEVGAVAGNIMVRNADTTLIAGFQAIEYLLGLSLGKRAQDLLGQVSCASGAFGAFRRDALQAVGGLDAGGGEDLDLTLRLRAEGYVVRFAAAAIGYTDVPATPQSLARQRFRWERDAVALRYRRHVATINPLSRSFDPGELYHELEFLVFNVVGAVALPVYILWLMAAYGDMAPAILIAAQLGTMAIDTIMLTIALMTLSVPGSARLFLLIPGYSLYNGVVMRMVRLVAYVEEWIFHASRADSYVPPKVNKVRF